MIIPFGMMARGGGVESYSGLVGGYRFDSDINDRSGSDIDLTNVGGVLTNGEDDGSIGGSATFSGTSQYLTGGNSSNWSFVDGSGDIAFEIDFWVKHSSVGGLQFYLSKRQGGVLDEWSIGLSSGSLFFQIYSGGTTANLIYVAKSAWNPVVGIWYHINVAYTGSGLHTGLSLRVDDVDIGTSAQAGAYTGMIDTSSTFVVGSTSLAYTTYEFHGKIDELKIWKKNNTARQRSLIHQIESGGDTVII